MKQVDLNKQQNRGWWWRCEHRGLVSNVDKRLEAVDRGGKLEDYLRDKVPAQTKKATNYAVCLYERVMSSAAKQLGLEFNILRETAAAACKTSWKFHHFSEYEPKIEIKKDDSR